MSSQRLIKLNVGSSTGPSVSADSELLWNREPELCEVPAAIESSTKSLSSSFLLVAQPKGDILPVTQLLWESQLGSSSSTGLVSH